MPRFRLPWRRRGDQSPGLACQEIVELVTAYLEGTLSSSDRVRFEAHIAGCDACTMYLEQMRSTLSMLGELRAESLSQDAVRELEAAFADWSAGR